MQEKMSFDYLTSTVMGDHYRDMRRHKYLVKAMLEFVEKDEVKGFYPKNLFSDDQALKCHVFTASKLLIFEEIDNQIIVNVQKYDQIKAARLEREKDERPDETVTITFVSGDDLVLDPKNDANSHWYDAYKASAIEIFKLIIKAP